ncbi:hypothetical protein HDU79_005024 [Rhizoclosmatium sp. JEL0117]|nr:hypothetical protein HDU79_005024 [Rhizoclosmatium sp. JEL0117]
MSTATATPTASVSSKTSTSPTLWAIAQPFVFGGVSGMAATTIIQPIDMVKVRIQLAGEGAKGKGASAFAVASSLIRSHGIAAFYTGLSAGLLRQATYTTARMGIFNSLIEYIQKDGAKASLSQRAIAGLAAGGLGAVAGNPCDLALIRMQADGLLPAAQRANYTSVIDAIVRIAKTEGVLALWKGCGPTVVRAMALNLGMLSTYSEAKSRLEPVLGKNSYATNLGASAVAGFFASFFSLPFDFLKTRMQKGGTSMYKGTLDCAVQVIQKEGPLAFYKGFPTYYIRIAPHAMITLLTADALNSFAKKYLK